MSKRTEKLALARKEETRIRFLEKVIEFIKSVTRECGELLYRTPGTIHTVYELRNFGGFTFYIDADRNGMHGGHTVKIWHHPSGQYAESLPPVLDISWQMEIGKSVPDTFDERPWWQRTILKIIQRRKGIAAKIDRSLEVIAKEEVVRHRKRRRRRPPIMTVRRIHLL